MNFSWKKDNWHFELMIIIIAIYAINLSVDLIGFNNVFSIITGQMINLAGFGFLLYLALFHIKNNSNQLLYFFKKYVVYGVVYDQSKLFDLGNVGEILFTF